VTVIASRQYGSIGTGYMIPNHVIVSLFETGYVTKALLLNLTQAESVTQSGSNKLVYISDQITSGKDKMFEIRAFSPQNWLRAEYVDPRSDPSDAATALLRLEMLCQVHCTITSSV
jgi:hypothetical protein